MFSKESCPAGTQPVVYIHSRIHRRSHRSCHSMRMAYDTDDRKLLPEIQQVTQQVDHYRDGLRSLDHRDLCRTRTHSDRTLRSLGAQRTRHECRFQHRILHPARHIRHLLHGRLRTDSSRQVEQQDGLEGRHHHRLPVDILHGVHALPCIVQLHRPDHRHAACRGRRDEQLHISRRRHGRLRHRPRAPLLGLRNVPHHAQVNTQERRMDEHSQGRARIP